MRNSRLMLTGMLLMALTSCAGCHVHLIDPIPHVHGQWTGRAETVKVTGKWGGSYQVAAIRISEGTPLPSHWKVREELGGGSVPLLAHEWEATVRAVTPSKLPRNRLVQVDGEMYVRDVLNPPGSDPLSGPSYVSRDPRSHPGAARIMVEHIIVVDGDVKLLEESKD